MKKIVAVCLLLAFCLSAFAGCASYPSKDAVETYAKDVLEAVVAKDTAKLQSLAHPDYSGYFSENEMERHYARYEQWGICDPANTVGALTRLDWDKDDYYGSPASEADYKVSIGGILYEFEIVVVSDESGEGVANFELERID